MLKLYVYAVPLQTSGYTQLCVFHNYEVLDACDITTIMVWLLIPGIMR